MGARFVERPHLTVATWALLILLTLIAATA